MAGILFARKMTKKILYLRTNYWFGLTAGGSVGHTSGVINALRKLHQVVKVISNDHLTDVKNDIEIVKPIKAPFLINSINEFLYNFKIIKSVNVEKYDAIYHRYNAFSFSSAYLASKNNIPLILEYNSSDLWKLKNWENKIRLLKFVAKRIYHLFFMLPIVSRIENYNFKKAGLIVVVSKAMRDELVARGIDEKKILVNPNGVDIEQYSPLINSKEIKKKYQLQKKIVLGFIGTFGQWHGAENIVLAYRKLLREYPEYKKKSKLMMIGDGIKMPEVKKNINEGGISENVILTWLIPQSEGPKYLSACDILINSTVPNPDGSEFFGSPTKLFEYMAMGKAIICSDMAQMSEVLTHNKTAYMVKPADIYDLIIAMKHLLDNIELRNKLGENARKEATSKHTWDKHVEKILERIS